MAAASIGARADVFNALMALAPPTTYWSPEARSVACITCRVHPAYDWVPSAGDPGSPHSPQPHNLCPCCHYITHVLRPDERALYDVACEYLCQ